MRSGFNHYPIQSYHSPFQTVAFSVSLGVVLLVQWEDLNELVEW